jgi:hypothetical protein
MWKNLGTERYVPNTSRRKDQRLSLPLLRNWSWNIHGFAARRLYTNDRAQLAMLDLEKPIDAK